MTKRTTPVARATTPKSSPTTPPPSENAAMSTEVTQPPEENKTTDTTTDAQQPATTDQPEQPAATTVPEETVVTQAPEVLPEPEPVAPVEPVFVAPPEPEPVRSSYDVFFDDGVDYLIREHRLNKDNLHVELQLVLKGMSNYYAVMRTNAPFVEADAARHQTRLYNVFKHAYSAPPSVAPAALGLIEYYFKQYSTSQNGNNLFSPKYIFRAHNKLTLSSADLSSFQALLNMFIQLAQCTNRHDIKTKISIRRLVDTLTSDSSHAKQNVTTFLTNLK